MVNNELSEINYFMYFLISTSIGCVEIFRLMMNDFSYLSFTCLIILGLILPIICFLANQYYKVPHFIEKYYALSFVVVIRFLVFLLLFVVASCIVVISISFILKFVAPEKVIFISQSLKYFSEQMAQSTSFLHIGQQLVVVSIFCLYTLMHYRDLCQKYAGKCKEEKVHN